MVGEATGEALAAIVKDSMIGDGLVMGPIDQVIAEEGGLKALLAVPSTPSYRPTDKSLSAQMSLLDCHSSSLPLPISTSSPFPHFVLSPRKYSCSAKNIRFVDAK